MRKVTFVAVFYVGATGCVATGCSAGSSEATGDAGDAKAPVVEPLADDAMFQVPSTTATAMSPLGLFARTESANGSMSEIRLYIFGARLTYAKKCIFEGGISAVAAATVAVRAEHVLYNNLRATVLESNPKQTEVSVNNKVYRCDVNPTGKFELFFNGKKMTEQRGKEFLEYDKLGDVPLPLGENSLFQKAWVMPSERAVEPMRGMFVSLDSVDPDYGETRFNFRPPTYEIERLCISRNGELFRSNARGTFEMTPERNFSGRVSFSKESETATERCPLPPLAEWTMYRQEPPAEATYQQLTLGSNSPGGIVRAMFLAGR